MNLILDKPKKLFIHYLIAALGGALIVSVYSLVDTAMIGQYEGSLGVAAIACISPMWNLIYSSGLLVGMGGATIMATKFGNEEYDEGKKTFTVGLILALIISITVALIMIFFEDQLLILFGADEELLPLCKKYLKYLKFSYPMFTFAQFLIPFVRNDRAPMTATISTLIAGVLNAIGDYLCVFVFDLGIVGAGIATAFGQYIACFYLFIHFLSKENNLKIVKVDNFLKRAKEVFSVGIPVFVLDIAMGILAIVMNNSIMKYFDSDALAVYGVILNANILVQASAYAIGNCAQPLISNNLGGKKYDRIISFTKLSVMTCCLFTIVWVSFLMFTPTQWIKLFMIPNQRVLEIAPFIMRSYYTSYLFMIFNVFMTYYLQAILKQRMSFIITILRGLIFSILFITILPLINKQLLWYSMLLDEVLISIIGGYLIIKYSKEIKNQSIDI